MSAEGERHQYVMRRLLAVLTVLAVIGALKLTAPVSMPLAFALFLVAVFWPLQRRLERRVPRWAAVLGTLGAFMAVMGLLVGALWFATEQVAEQAPRYADEFEHYSARAGELAKELGADDSGGAVAIWREAAGYTFATVAGLLLVVAFFVLALLEVHEYRAKLAHSVGHEPVHWLDPLHRITSDFQRYIAVRTLVGLITGVAVYLVALLAGLDFAFIWGLINFILNYIPTLGSVVAVVPPVVFALFQTGDPAWALAVFAMVGGVQLLMGNYVDPLLQGHYLRLSPLVVLLSVVFWGWVWGVPGAFIGVPLTVGVVIGCAAFPQTRWIARLLSRGEGVLGEDAG